MHKYFLIKVLRLQKCNNLSNFLNVLFSYQSNETNFTFASLLIELFIQLNWFMFQINAMHV